MEDNYTFYNTVGDKITRDEFIKLYNSIYFFTNSIYLEEQIEDIYKKGFGITYDDLESILIWKTSGKKAGDDIITQYGSTISISDLGGIINKLKELNYSDNLRTLYTCILDQHVKNIGSVYSLTIVSFLTENNYPIYDKFAKKALDAISEKVEFRKAINYLDMPDKSDVDGVLKRYNDYIELLTKIFGDSWKKSRKIDRALWTYGHMF